MLEISRGQWVVLKGDGPLEDRLALVTGTGARYTAIGLRYMDQGLYDAEDFERAADADESVEGDRIMRSFADALVGRGPAAE